MAGDGVGDDIPRSRTKQPAGAGGRRQQPTAASLMPLDILLEIAARSDPVTLVRCAATCRDVRHRVAHDPTFRLRLRHADRFVPPLLRGHVIERNRQKRHRASKLFTVEDASRLLATHSGHDGDCLGLKQALASRDGLLLLRVEEELRVCDLWLPVGARPCP